MKLVKEQVWFNNWYCIKTHVLNIVCNSIYDNAWDRVLHPVWNRVVVRVHNRVKYNIDKI